MSSITLPNDWEPMPHQVPLYAALDNGIKRADLCWHRRSGKDSCCVNYTAKSMWERVGNYWHLLPTQKQARKAIWNGIDREGRRIIDQAFPKALRTRSDGTEMLIEMKSGSTWQLCGSDNYDSLVGSNPVGVVFSEWALCDPKAWDYVRPILTENGGWAIFIYTARGKNHAYRMHQMAQKNESWFSSTLTVDDTARHDGSPIIDEEAIQAERDEGVGEEVIQQEYYCDFDIAMPGAYYAAALAKCRKEKRIGVVVPDPHLPIKIFVDIGGTGAKSDAFTMWACQFVGQQILVHNYYEAVGQPIKTHLKWLRSEGYDADEAEIYLPHDGDTNDKVYDVSYASELKKAGYRVTVVPNQGKGAAKTRVEKARKEFDRVWFNEETCQAGIEALGSYHEKWDEKRNIGLGPEHDWSSHAADAFGMMAVVYSVPRKRKPMPKKKAAYV